MAHDVETSASLATSYRLTSPASLFRSTRCNLSYADRPLERANRDRTDSDRAVEYAVATTERADRLDRPHHVVARGSWNGIVAVTFEDGRVPSDPDISHTVGRNGVKQS